VRRLVSEGILEASLLQRARRQAGMMGLSTTWAPGLQWNRA
jgi:hypothetical protein